MPTTSGQAQEPWSGDLAVAHVGLFDFTGALREKRLSAAAFKAALADGWRFIDALPFWMHDETCFAERGFVDETVAIGPDAARRCPSEPRALLAVADYAGPSADVSPRCVLKRLVEFDYNGLPIRKGTTLHLLSETAGTDPDVFRPGFDMAVAFTILAPSTHNLRANGAATYLPDSGNTGAVSLPVAFDPQH